MPIVISKPVSWTLVALAPWALASLPATSGCAEGSETAPGATASTGVTWSSASSGGSGGVGGDGSSSQGGGGSTTSAAGGSGGGPGGAGGSGSGGSGAGGSATGGGGGTGGSGGGITSGDVVLLASGSGTLLGGHFVQANGWTTATLSGSSNDAPALTVNTNRALGAWRGAADALRFTLFDGSAWSAPSDVAASVTTRAAPSLASLGGSSQLVFHGTDFMHYFAGYQSSWMPTAEPVAPNMAAQSFGPSAARTATLGSDTVIAFAGNDGQLYAQTRTSAWQPAVALTGSKVSAPPAIAALTSGAELLVVYINDDAGQPDDNKLFWATRSGGLWTSAQKISDTIFTDEPPALASMSSGRALLAFRGSDGMPYVLTYDPNANPVWSSASGIATTNIAVVSPPAVASGGSGALAELAYVASAGGGVGHVRLTNSGWSAPVVVGGSNLSHVAIASAP